MNNVEIGKRIKQRRLELGYTQSFIYNKTGISTGNLSGIEKVLLHHLLLLCVNFLKY